MRLLTACISTLVLTGQANGATRPFSVIDEIGLAHFGELYRWEVADLQFSPDGHYVAALTERGRIDLNRPEDTLRIYRTKDVRAFLRGADDSQPPMPWWELTTSTDKDGPLITHWRWLADSSGIAFLQRGAFGSHRLVLADLERKSIGALTPEGWNINAYDIRDRNHFIYSVADPSLAERAVAESQAAAIVGSGRPLSDLLYPVDQNPEMARFADRSQLWAAIEGKSFQVTDQASGKPLVLFSEGQNNLTLSPDGKSVVTVLPVEEVPSEWEHRYPPPSTESWVGLRAGKQDLSSFDGSRLVGRYVDIHLPDGTVRALTDGPTGLWAGWGNSGAPVWSSDGKTLALPDAFVVSGLPTTVRACVAVVKLVQPSTSCVELEKEGEYTIDALRFAAADGRDLDVSHLYYRDQSRGSTEYRQSAAGTWMTKKQTAGADAGAVGSLQLTVREGLNTSPALWVEDTKTKVSRMIWDPNPQLKDIALGEVTVYRWTDRSGRNWSGGLFKPVPYEVGHRYPLVIQTHGFSETEFRPSGLFPTAFAARALAGAGLVVLQANMCPSPSSLGSPDEGVCNVEGLEAAIEQLVRSGLVDPTNIGIIGFSRTCFHVMEFLTSSAIHLKAASITDGVMEDYLQYMQEVDDSTVAREFDVMVGARPFGHGLQQWLTRSPLFNIDKVSAPLQVVGLGRWSLLSMWGPYAALRYLHKPVDLILINTDEHVLSNPAARIASQGGTVDWFRFWLQDYEDPDPAKAEQYRRWEGLCDMQVQQNPNQSVLCVHSRLAERTSVPRVSSRLTKAGTGRGRDAS